MRRDDRSRGQLMPTIAQATEAAQNLDRSRYQVVEPPQSHMVPTPDPVSIQRDPFLLSPLPPVGSSPDSLRQYYRPSIPQTRCTPITPALSGLPFSDTQLGDLQTLADQQDELSSLASNVTPLSQLAANAAALLALL